MGRLAPWLSAFACVFACAALAANQAAGASAAPPRVTFFGDSSATAIQYTPRAASLLGAGLDLQLELAACRRLGEASCPYDGVRPPNVVDRAAELAGDLGPTVVVAVGYNDYESTYAEQMERALAVFRRNGVERVLWLTLRASRNDYAGMNQTIASVGRRHPEMTIVDWNGRVGTGEGLLQPDGVHLTPEGAVAMAALVREALVAAGVSPVRPRRPAPLRIAAPSLPSAHVGRRYVARLKATGGAAPYRFARVGGVLPRGVKLAVDGRLSGLPARTGRFELRVRVTDRAGATRTGTVALRVTA